MSALTRSVEHSLGEPCDATRPVGDIPGVWRRVLRPISGLLGVLGVPEPVTIAIDVFDGATSPSSSPWVTFPDDPPPPLTGPRLASGSFRGRFGDIQDIEARGIGVRVYADRIVVRPPFNGRRTIMAENLLDLYYDPRHIVRIEHTAPGILSPVCLKLRLPHPLHDAILEVFDNQSRLGDTD